MTLSVFIVGLLLDSSGSCRLLSLLWMKVKGDRVFTFLGAPLALEVGFLHLDVITFQKCLWSLLDG